MSQTPEQPAFVYVTWDGPGARYLRSLYLPIFKRSRHSIRILQVSYGEQEELEKTRQMAVDCGVPFEGHHVRSDKLSRARGFARLVQRTRHYRKQGNIIVPRALVPAAAALLAQVPQEQLVFDADGLVADERAEHAGWSRGALPYRGLRDVEFKTAERASAVLVRTERAADILHARAPGARIFVAHNGSDEEQFAPLPTEERSAFRRSFGVDEDEFLIIYAGSLGPQYCPELMVECVAGFAQQQKTALVLLAAPSDTRDSIEQAAQTAGAKVITRFVAPQEVPAFIASADLGLALRKPSFSQGAVSPIKVGEYLLCGIPVVANAGVGDLDEAFKDTAGLYQTELTSHGLEAFIERFMHAHFDPAAIRKSAVKRYSVNAATNAYDRAFDTMNSAQPTSQTS